MPGGSGGGCRRPGLRPDSKRNREFLEQFSLDTLKMVGTLKLSGRTMAWCRPRTASCIACCAGNYLGQNDGKITDITPRRSV